MKTVMLRNVEVGCGKPKVIVPIVAATAQGILEKAREFRAHALDGWSGGWTSMRMSSSCLRC